MSHAVFISYASQDAEAAGRICEALGAAGIEVWFDQSELRGGDAWDQSIRKQIKTCALFLPVISRNTHDRDEGYFRLEWKLAIDRCHLMAADKAFLVPVVIDDTRDDDERVPERFREVQWSRLPRGATTTAFVERVRRLLADELPQERTGTDSATARGPAAPTSRKPVLASWRSKAALFATIAVLVAALSYFVAYRHAPLKRGAEVEAASGSAAQHVSAAATAFNPSSRSIAVLPFVNMSGDKEQEYFSDGLTEEILNSLARINELQVCARTSSFSFRGKDTDVQTIARKLNVGAILEGSVRRSGKTVRITAQLINAATGFHMWSDTYDRDLRDVLKVQTEIATAVARALKVTLLGNVAVTSELGGTRNPEALDAYLRGRKMAGDYTTGENLLAAAAAFSDAIRLDRAYALAFVSRSYVLNEYAANWATGAAVQDRFAKAGDDARRAVALAPDLGEAHLALASYYTGTFDLARADDEYARALALAPGNAFVLGSVGLFTTQMGRIEAGIAAVYKAVQLDPLSGGPQGTYGYALYLARRHEAALTAYGHAIVSSQVSGNLQSLRGLVYYALGDFKQAESSCQNDYEGVDTMVCLAVAYEKLGRHADAQSMLTKFMKLRGDADAYAYAEIYAQWGDTHGAMGWLEKAVRLRDSGLILVKTDPFLDPLRREPRFQEIERELKFPD